MLLSGLVRRTVGGEWRGAGAGAGLAAGLLWVVHPLATASVSYVSQRTEVLMGFFYLLTLYAFVRGWRVVAVVTCALGMLCKEPMATAPLLVWLYDRTFVSGSLGAAWRARRGFYAALASTWGALAWVLSTGLEQRSVGFGQGVSGFEYAGNACSAMLVYLKLAVWPAPLVFDYGRSYAVNAGAVVAVLALLAAAGWAVWRRNGIGFVAAGFFLLLAPTTSFVPVAEQPIAENRMYLPLALLSAGAAAGWLRVAGRKGVLAMAAAVVALAAGTVARNRAYASEVTLWADTVAKRPENARAQFNLGAVLLNAGREREAAAALERAVRLEPEHGEARNALANAWARLGEFARAWPQYEEAVRLRPGAAKAWYDYGSALLKAGDAKGATERLERAVALRPEWAEARNELGNAYFESGDAGRAVEQYEAAIRLEPGLAEARYNAGSACLELGRVAAAVEHFTAAAKLKPQDAEVRNNLGVALLKAGRATEAVRALEEAMRLRPGYEEARGNLEAARRMGR
jgi:tetratricopeptide (TPR) repeat protein